MPMCMGHPVLLVSGGMIMQKSYFEMTLEKTIKRAEKLLQKLKSVRELYGERKIETAMKESYSQSNWLRS